MCISLNKPDGYYQLNNLQPNITRKEDCSFLFKEEKDKILTALEKINYNVSFDIDFSIEDIKECHPQKEASVFILNHKHHRIKILWSTYSADVIIDDYMVNEYGDDSSTTIYQFDAIAGNREKWQEHASERTNKVHLIDAIESQKKIIHYIKNKLHILIQDIEKCDTKKGPIFNLKKATAPHFELGTYVIFVDKPKLEALYNKKPLNLCGELRMLSLGNPLNGVNPLAHEGWIYIQIESHIDCIHPKMDINVVGSHSSKYPIIFKPKNITGLYFYETKLNNDEYYQYQHAKSLIKYDKYDGSHIEPALASVREIYADELSIPLEYYKELKSMHVDNKFNKLLDL